MRSSWLLLWLRSRRMPAAKTIHVDIWVRQGSLDRLTSEFWILGFCLMSCSSKRRSLPLDCLLYSHGRQHTLRRSCNLTITTLISFQVLGFCSRCCDCACKTLGHNSHLNHSMRTFVQILTKL